MKITIVGILCLLLTSVVVAEETRVDVRVISRGGSLIGDSVGGARIVIEDYDTGEILAEGLTEGPTQEGQRIMTEEKPHHSTVSTEESPVFHAIVNIERPLKVKISATGPMNEPQSVNTVTLTQWIIPGFDIIEGDAFLITLPGLIVKNQSLAEVPFEGEPVEFQIQARVAMMCGCPITPDLPWNPAQFRAMAWIMQDGKVVRRVPLRYADIPSQFEASARIEKPGSYRILIIAFQPENGNAGVDRGELQVGEKERKEETMP
ncbi:hypothetical protein HQ520_07285 [bacterium]|nr:hypothetical protein [bacterium]